MSTFHRRMLGRVMQKRFGTATVELAVCLPMLVTFGLGAIETTNAIFLKQRVTTASYECARSASAPGQTSAGATTVANNVLSQLAVSGGTVTITPTVTAWTSPGTPIIVTIAAPTNSNLCMPPFVVGKVISSVTATVVMNHQ